MRLTHFVGALEQLAEDARRLQLADVEPLLRVAARLAAQAAWENGRLERADVIAFPAPIKPPAPE